MSPLKEQLHEYLRGPMSLKDVSDWVKVIAFFFLLAAGYGRLMYRVDAYGQAISDTQRQTLRIERYLSSKDTSYWPTVKEFDTP
jgi:hypothetical protein